MRTLAVQQIKTVTVLLIKWCALCADVHSVSASCQEHLCSVLSAAQPRFQNPATKPSLCVLDWACVEFVETVRWQRVCQTLPVIHTGRMWKQQSCGVTSYLAAPLSLPGSRNMQVETDACVATTGLSPPVTLLHNNEICSVVLIKGDQCTHSRSYACVFVKLVVRNETCSSELKLD